MTDAPRRIFWALEWRSQNAVDGKKRHLLNEDFLPCLFLTRDKARAYANDRYGYIRTRPDLRAEPHGWRMPQPVRVTVRKVTR